MNNDAQRVWKAAALTEVLRAIAQSETLCARLIFKGGRILHRRLGREARQSYDLDAALTQAFVAEFPEREAQRRAIHDELTSSLARYFARVDPVQFTPRDVRVVLKPRDAHPQGWNAFEVQIRLVDLALQRGQTPPTLTIDLSAPESLGPKATATMDVDGHQVTAYTLERIAGEKLRAFLSSLPTHRAKFAKPGNAVRAKDLYDLACIATAMPLSNSVFWDTVALEFGHACASRHVDCVGIASFAEQFEVTRAAYEGDATIPKDIPFDVAWSAVREIVSRFAATGAVPRSYPSRPSP